jgi:osmotically-inducible protein OsmY
MRRQQDWHCRTVPTLRNPFMKTDSEVQKDVIEELSWDASTRQLEIGVSAKAGVVTLFGEVPTFSAKLAAEAAAERVSGVRALADDLTVKLSTAHTRSDTALAHAALNAMQWDVDVPDQKIQLKVENGWLTLDGIVDNDFQRRATERAVRYLAGVRGLTSHIKVQPTGVSTSDVTISIKRALHRSAELDAKRIIVEAHDGTVTLRGTVRSWAERGDVERAAWSAPGVRQVEDQLLVGT